MNTDYFLGDSIELIDVIDYKFKAIQLYTLGKSKEAIELCLEGLEKFPMNKILLAYVILFCTKSEDYDLATKYYILLKDNIPMKEWDMRQFSYSLIYLLNKNEIDENQCRNLIRDYKEYVPDDERAYLFEGVLEFRLGNICKSKELLTNHIMKIYNTPHCILQLLNIYLGEENYEEVVYLSKYFVISGYMQPPYFSQTFQAYEKYMSEDAEIHIKLLRNERVEKSELHNLINSYKGLLECTEPKIYFDQQIEKRIKKLQELLENSKL